MWAKPRTGISKSVHKDESLPHLTVEKPSPHHWHPHSGGHAGTEGPPWCQRPQARRRCHFLQKPASAFCSQKIGPLANYFRQRRYFSNHMYVEVGSKLGYSLRQLPCPHHEQATNNSKNALLAEKEFSDWKKKFFFQKGNNPVQENLLAVCWPDVILLLHLNDNIHFC